MKRSAINGVHGLPRKGRPIGIKVVTSGCHIKLDLIELIEIADYVSSEVRLEERTSGIIPVTAWEEYKL